MSARPAGPAVLADPARLAAVRALCLDDERATAPLDRLTRLAAMLLGAPAALVNILEQDRQVTRSAFDVDGRYRRGAEARASDSLCAIVVQSGARVVIDDTRAHEVARGMSCVAGGVAAYAGVPLALASGHTIGTLCVFDRTPRHWTASELDILTELAALAVSELELRAATLAAEARADTVASARRLRAVERIVDAALTQTSLHGTLVEVLVRLREELGTDTATVLLLEPDGASLRVVASVGLEAEVEAGVVVPVGQGVSGRIAQTREPVIIAQLATADVASPLLRQRVQSLIGAPLLLHGELMGVVHGGTVEQRDFTEGDLRLLVLAAGRLAAIIERARLFDAEHAARVAAESASRAKTEFLTVMSHELRTPLNAIGGYAQLMEDGIPTAPTEGQRTYLTRIVTAQRHLSRLIDDILQIVAAARDGEPSGGGVRDGVASLADVLDRLRDEIAPRAEAAGLRYAHEGVCPVELGVSGDAAVVLDALRRVADNAVKFTPAGGAVTVRCESDADAVRITVRDTGVGIPPERLESVFDAFGRVDSSYRRAHEGLGVGLALARAGVRRLGGELTVEGADGGGTVASIVLPRAGCPDR